MSLQDIINNPTKNQISKKLLSFVDGRFCFASFFYDISSIVQIILYMTLIIKAQSVSIDYRFYSKGILGLNTKHL
jgi:hypothetical protein